jgi:hypothetical protein
VPSFPQRGVVSATECGLFFIPPLHTARRIAGEHAWGPKAIHPFDLLHSWGDTLRLSNPENHYPPLPREAQLTDGSLLAQVHAVRRILRHGGNRDARAWQAIGWPDELASEFARKHPLKHPLDGDVDAW